MTLSCPTSIHRLRAHELEVDVDTESGAVVAIRLGDWNVLGRGAIGGSFRMLLRAANRQANLVQGSRQAMPQCSISNDGCTVTAVWDVIVDDNGEPHNITVRTQITAAKDRVIFGIELDNACDLTVENVYFPDFGDVRPTPSGRLDAFTFTGTSARIRSSLWPNFSNAAPYWGVNHPTFLCGSGASLVPMNPMVPWILLEDGSMGMFFGLDNPSTEPITWSAELLPGYEDSITWPTGGGGRAPTGDQIGEHTVAMRFAAVHLPFLAAGARRALTPVALAGYFGDWHKGADQYIKRRENWGTPTATPPDWARNPHSWLQLQLNSQERNRPIQFSELPAIAAECANYGVAAIQVVGWTEGGQDGEIPSHRPDPRLGGSEALRAAIAQSQALGVKIILYAKFTWADRLTDRFQSELVNHAVKDPYGDYYLFAGYRYQSITQLVDISVRRLVPMCFQSEGYLKICQQEFGTIVELGADGMLYDEAHWHGSQVCFDPTHQHNPGASVYANDRELVSRFRQIPSLREDFLFACEAPYDLEWEAYQLGYIRSSDPQYMPVNRYLRPHCTLMTAVVGFDDRNMINQCLMYRYVISYEPFNFKGRLSDAPRTVSYGQAMDQLRSQLREWFWDATFIDTVGVSVHKEEGAAHHPYAAYRHDDGRIALVVVNYSDEPSSNLVIHIEGQTLPLQFRLVDDPTWRPVSPQWSIPPRSAAVLVPSA